MSLGFINLNSNVVAEFPRSKKLIKYPRVALTADAQTELGYEGYFVSQDSATLNGTSNRQAWAFFDIEGPIYYQTPLTISTSHWMSC